MARTTPNQDHEIAEQRAGGTFSLRPVSPALEEILFTPIPVLDHGFIRVVDYLGNDEAVVQAARVSYGRGTRKTSEDAALIHYLMRHAHTTPFEMAEIKLHVKLPIFVARQWIRHRTASVNEYSARYSILDKEFYLPDLAQMATQSHSNRQGRGDVLNESQAQMLRSLLESDSTTAYEHYLQLLNEDDRGEPLVDGRTGLAREISRIVLPLSYYTQWYWKIDLHNFMGFLKLRLDPHAQYEIRAYADVLLDVLRRWTPLSFEAFMEHRVKAVNVSARAADVLRAMLHGSTVTPGESGLSSREWAELCRVFDLDTSQKQAGST